MKKKAFILLILFTGLILSFLFFLYQNNKKPYGEDNYQYKLSYIYAGVPYIIYSYGDSFTVIKQEYITCIKAPCNPILKDAYRVAFRRNSMRKANAFFEALFRNSNSNELSGLMEDDLTENELALLRGILNRNERIFQNKQFSFDSYEVVSEDYYGNYSKKGFHQNEDGSITISMGKRNTGGYSIGVLKATIKNQKLSIFVQEQGPKEGSIVTQAITNPQITIRMKEKYSSVVVHDAYSNSWEEL